ncbi:hypothetical protein HOY80DRAFT_1040840 [Tuber brumale]|nr:hypothetical protein HOY80DRAFT_1040840 [Tuber brumale]
MLFTTFTSLSLIARTYLHSISVKDKHRYNRTFNAYLGQIDGEIDIFFAQDGFQIVENSFRNGRTFEADKLLIENYNTPPLEFTTSQSKSFNRFTDAKNLATQIQVKVDGLVFSALDKLILLQITIAKSHDIKPSAVKKLYESLPTINNIHIVFVIPEDYKGEYLQAQSILEARNVKQNASSLEINQFPLVLSEETMKLLVLDGAFKALDRGGDLDTSDRDDTGGDTAIGDTQ